MHESEKVFIASLCLGYKYPRHYYLYWKFYYFYKIKENDVNKLITTIDFNNDKLIIQKGKKQFKKIVFRLLTNR